MSIARFVFTFILFISLAVMLNAQTFIQLEKRGSLKNKRYYEGEILHFQLENDKTWYAEEMRNIMVEDQLILFENRIVSIDKITKIRDGAKGQFMRGLGNKIMLFGASFLGISLVSTLADWELQNDTYIISGSALATGGALRLLFNNRSYKMGKQRWLRAVSLDFQEKKDLY